MLSRMFKGLLVTVLLVAAEAAQAQAPAPSEPLRLSTDVCRFRGVDDSHMNVELYYSFPQSSLTYRQDTAGFKGTLDLTMIVRLKDSVVYADRWLVPHVLRDTARMPRGMNLVGMNAVELGPGIHSIRLIGRDRLDSTRVDSVSMTVPVVLLGSEKVAVSDVEFASDISQGAKGTMFYKNTLEVIPNVSGVYGEKQRCYYYAELYNLLLGDDRGDYYVRTAVANSVGKEIISREKPKKRSVESIVFMDNFGVDNLRTGTYTLSLSVLDSNRAMICGAGKKFFVYNPTLGVDSTVMAAGASGFLGVYTAMEVQELDREFHWDQWESTDAEKKSYEQLQGVDAKRKFLSEFWKKRGPDKRREYLDRVAYVNRTFTFGGRDGFRTDRGRVYIMYGPPDDYERHPYESDMRPYEIWTYNSIQGGVIFVFVQRLSAGDYELVHSTHRNEIHDENWDRPGVSR